MNHSPKLALLGLTLALSACSVLQSDKVDYKSAGKAPSLEVPPDLSQLARDNRYTVPGGAVTASGFQAGQATRAGAPMAQTVIADVRIERTGNQRWLVVDRPPEKLWDDIKDFWQDSGFLLLLDQKDLGIMETDWAENRAKIPDDFIRNTLGKVFGSLYSTGERDKFRTRLERNAAGGTEIFISHRGMIETYISNQAGAEAGSDTRWQPRPADPELEAEFLRRLMVKLGVSQEQSKALLAADIPKSTSRVANVDGLPVVQIDEGFDRAWRRVGLTLDRTGFTVEDRDRAQGIYFVRYVEPSADKGKEPGFFGKLFGQTAKTSTLQKYRIALRSEGSGTTVSVLSASGTPESSEIAQRIVKVIADDLK